MDDSFLNKRIASNPGAGKFRSNLVLVIVVAAIASYLTFVDDLTEQTHQIAKKQTITNINYSLSMMLYDFTIKGQQQDLAKFHHENPFVPLGIYRAMPPNYLGALAELKVTKDHQWFFDSKKKRLGYYNQGHYQFWQMDYVEEGNVGTLKLKAL